jgi:hypothetical protein
MRKINRAISVANVILVSALLTVMSPAGTVLAGGAEWG